VPDWVEVFIIRRLFFFRLSFRLSLSPFLSTFHGTKLNVSLNQSGGRTELVNEAKNQYRN
jgi:hypothetical protein